jgi:SAM-dependent methyltransferase
MGEGGARQHYCRVYQSQLSDEARWLSLGASHKADSIQLLLERNHIVANSMLELGAGTGAVIQECQRRGLASHYTAVDYSPDAITFLSKAASGIAVVVADITAPEFSLEGEFDVVVLSHVLEHLEEPGQLLGSLRRLRWRHLIAEVPLEGLVAGNLKRWLGKPPGKAAGHVQFFNAATFRMLLGANGLVCIDTHRYVPQMDLETIRFMCRKNGSSRVKYLQSALTSHYLPRVAESIWSRWYYAHYAVLCGNVREAVGIR